MILTTAVESGPVFTPMFLSGLEIEIFNSKTSIASKLLSFVIVTLASVIVWSFTNPALTSFNAKSPPENITNVNRNSQSKINLIYL